MKKNIGLMAVLSIMVLLCWDGRVSGAEGIANVNIPVTSVNIPVTYRNIQVFVDGRKIKGEEPFIINSKGIVMIPVRGVLEAAGKIVSWDPVKNIISIKNSPSGAKQTSGQSASGPGVKSGQVIPVTYRNIQVFVEGKKIGGEEPFVLDGKGIVMIPLRGVLEATGKQVVWDQKKNIVYVGKNPLSGQSEVPLWTGTETKKEQFVWLEDMMVLRNVGPFYRQTGKPFTIAAGEFPRGLGVRLKGSGSAEMVVRTHGKYKAIEGWLGIDDETRNTSGGYTLSIWADNEEVATNVIDDNAPAENQDTGTEKIEGMKDNTSIVTTYKKDPVFESSPILPASYPKYVSPALTDISGALTVTIRITWVDAKAPGDYAELTAVLANFKFLKQ